MNKTTQKYEKKAARRQSKYKHILLQETGIHAAATPTKYLMVGNAGLVTGLKHEILLEVCAPYGTVENIIMLPKKSYCFVIFQDVTDATAAYNSIHGKIRSPTDDSTFLYLVYTETVPETPLMWNFRFKPSGLIILEDFVSESEEALLLQCVDWNLSTANQSLKHRRVMHYGYEFRYDKNNVDKHCPLPNGLPSECDFLEDRVRQRANHLEFSPPDQLTVNQYQPGQGIPPHIDTHSAFEDPIFSLSLGSDVVMDFKHPDGQTASVILPRCSLLVMSRESRFVWSHGITPRVTDVVPLGDNGLTTRTRGIRTSFTFRTILKEEVCTCQYHQHCDSYERTFKQTSINSDEFTKKLESTHVYEVYEKIADHFSETRHKPWPNVLDFVTSLNTGSILVDIGCGNGKYFGYNKTIFEVGCDRSFGLAKVSQSRGFQVFNCNCLSLPFKDDSADGCISIAVIHHLASQERRLKAIKEIIRILRPSGKALIYVWAKDQERDKTKSSYLKQDRRNRKTESSGSMVTSAPELHSEITTLLPVHTNRTQFKHQDLLVPWKIKPNMPRPKDKDSSDSNSCINITDNNVEEVPTFLRYYHVFEEGELELMCSSIDNASVIKSFYDQGNWCVVLEKS